MSGMTSRIRPVYQLGRPGGPPSPPCLVVIFGPDLGRKIPIDEGGLTIGRGEDNDLIVPVDGVSRTHVALASRADGVHVRDLGSTNGTWVDGSPIEPDRPLRLRSGQRIELVGVVFKFLAGDDVEALYHEEIYQLTIADGLTRAYNRRYLMDFLAREISRCRRHERPLSLILIDVDRFKQVNDVHGHAAGDHVLRDVVGLVGEVVRREECLARYGGDEFALVLPDTPLEGARIVAERIRLRVEGHRFAFAGRAVDVTVSLGVATLVAPIADPEAFLAAADARLYAAKAAGRNAADG